MPHSPYRLAGVTAGLLGLLLVLWKPLWAWIPLALLLGLGALAALFPGLSFYLPVLCRGPRSGQTVGLSFDDGPDPEVTPRVLALLAQRGLKALFCVVGQRAEAHPELIRALVDQGHEVIPHGARHDVWVTLKGRQAFAAEVDGGRAPLEALGIRPLAFRPAVGLTNPHLGPLLEDRGMFCLGFSCRGWDGGNRRIVGLADRLLRKVRPGDVILLHDTRPLHHPVEAWLQELERLLDGLATRGLVVVPVSRLLDRPLMERLP